MKSMRKLWLTIASVCVVVGCSIFAVTMTACSWNFKALNTQKNISNTYEVNEDFNTISMDTSTADITFLSSTDGKCKVVCQEFEKEKHSVAVENSTLTIKAVNERKWYDYIGINIGKVEVTVYLPKTEYQALIVKEDTGDITLKGLTFDSIDMELSTGDVNLTDITCAGEIKIGVSTGDVNLQRITCKNFTSEGDTGEISLEDLNVEESISITRSTGDAELDDVTCKTLKVVASTGELSMENVIATKKIEIERSTGDVEFERCDAPEIVIVTDTGDVEGSLLTGKDFTTETDTGRVRVPQDSAGGICKITTDTGDIEITIVG